MKERLTKRLFIYLLVVSLSASHPFLENGAMTGGIQQPITNVRRNGDFGGVTVLRSAGGGAKQKYKIYILAHRDKDRFHDGCILEGLPDDCVVSDDVIVERTR